VSCPFDPATSGLTTAVNFKGALERIAALLSGRSCYTIEMGAHPTLTLTAVATLVARGVRVIASIESMRRGQPIGFFESEASKLAHALKAATPAAPLPNGASTSSAADDARDTSETLKASPQTLVEIVTSILPTVGTSTFGGGVDMDAPLMHEGGLTSALVPRLVDEINRAFGTHHSAVLVLEAGTLRGLASRLLVGKGGGSSADITRVGAAGPHPWPGGSSARATPRVAPAVGGGGVGRLPGSARAEQLWQVAATGGNAISEVPSRRWAVTSHAAAADSETRTAAAAAGYGAGSYGGAGAGIQYGGFAVGAQRFDHMAFGVPPAEAQAMDPQQRLLLEVGYEAMHAASLRRGTLLDRNVGVFAGIMNTDSISLVGRGSVYAATGTQISIASGRLSFVLGTQGPCASVDTACSSALVAIEAAMLRWGGPPLTPPPDPPPDPP